MRAGPKALPPATKLPRMRAQTPSSRVVSFCRRFLTHVKGPHAGRPFVLARWQVNGIVRPLFDTLLPDGRRQYRECYVTMPRKNGKSTLGAALALYLLYADGEPGAEIVSAAADTDQARIVFDVARSMVEASGPLKDMTQVYQRELVVPATGSRYRVISAEAGTKHGMNLSGAIVDELHVWDARELYDVLSTSFGARSQPLMAVLTTAGDDEHGICAEVHRRAELVRDGVIENSILLPVIYAAPEEADWQDEAVWRACNPALGSFRFLEEMREKAREAKEIQARESSFRRLYLNQWGAEAAIRWIPLPAWDACRADPPAPRRERVYLGVDLSATTDLTALIVLRPDQDGGMTILASEFWCPEKNMDARARKDRVPYPLWAEQGYLKPTPGNSVDYSYVEARIHALMGEHDVVEVAFDPWNARDAMARLQRDNVPIVAVPQTMANLTSASKTLETLVLQRKLRHDGHPIMRFCVRNVLPDVDGNGNMKPSKKESPERIDGVSALVTALARAIVDEGGSVYERRGLRDL